jgi:hypothetical protein
MSLNANPKKSALRKCPLVSASKQSRQFPIVAPHHSENGVCLGFLDAKGHDPID